MEFLMQMILYDVPTFVTMYKAIRLKTVKSGKCGGENIVLAEGHHHRGGGQSK